MNQARAEKTLEFSRPKAVRLNALLGGTARRRQMEQRRKAPWPDYAGNPIHEGDTIRHPADGTTGVVFVLASEERATDRWQVLYGAFEPKRASRLCLQIGVNGQAVVVPPNTAISRPAETQGDTADPKGSA